MTKIQVEKLATLAGHKDCIYSLEKGFEKNTFFSAGGDGIVAQWSLVNPEIGDLVAKVPHSVYALCFIAEKKILIVGQNFEGLHFISLEEKKEIKSIKLTNTAIFDLQYYQDILLIACGDGVVIVLDLNEMTIRKHLKASDKSARCISINPIKQQFAVGYSDFTIQVFDMQNFNLQKSILAHNNSVFAVKYSPDGKHLLSGSRDAHLKIWDVESNYELNQSIVAHLFAINHITFSPDGNFFATCSMDKSIKIWDYHSFKLLKVIDKARHAGHGTSINKLFWADYENLLISASDDRMVSIWKLDFKME